MYRRFALLYGHNGKNASRDSNIAHRTMLESLLAFFPL